MRNDGIDVRFKIAALWTSAMFCYIYADYFGLFRPHFIQTMLAGKMPGFGAVTQPMLVGTSLMMAIPSVLICLSVILPRRINRVANIIFGLLYTGIIAATMWNWAFFIVYGFIEMALTLAVVWHAWTWGKSARVSMRSQAR